MTSVDGDGGEGSVSDAVKDGFDRGAFCDHIFFEIVCGIVNSDLSAELSLIISSSRIFIFGLVDPVFFSIPAFKVEISGDVDNIGDRSFIVGTAGTLYERCDPQFFL